MNVGHWQICEPKVEHRGINLMFWKTPDYPYPFCSMCLYRVRDRQVTLIQSPTPLIKSNNDAKPEKDSL